MNNAIFYNKEQYPEYAACSFGTYLRFECEDEDSTNEKITVCTTCDPYDNPGSCEQSIYTKNCEKKTDPQTGGTVYESVYGFSCGDDDNDDGPSSSTAFIILFVVVVLLLIGGAAGGYFYFRKQQNPDEPAQFYDDDETIQ